MIWYQSMLDTIFDMEHPLEISTKNIEHWNDIVYLPHLRHLNYWKQKLKIRTWFPSSFTSMLLVKHHVRWVLYVSHQENFDLNLSYSPNFDNKYNPKRSLHQTQSTYTCTCMFVVTFPMFFVCQRLHGRSWIGEFIYFWIQCQKTLPR